MTEFPWTIGVDLGGTKIETAVVDNEGKVLARERQPTPVDQGPDGVQDAIVKTVSKLLKQVSSKGTAVGVGVAGQVDADSGTVVFAPNLKWENVALQAGLKDALKLPVVVTNDVRAATWGEWLYGSGQSCDDLVCLFIGTGSAGEWSAADESFPAPAMPQGNSAISPSTSTVPPAIAIITDAWRPSPGVGP